ncbi:helix-turn-helix domain-containing protein [Streptomyces sp. LE64]|uniref:helix-turn-helix domain-containing protein n=1 Tax=Streptomyces sp. LE64 TaxID=3448653 RepID=UPI00404354F5
MEADLRFGAELRRLRQSAGMTLDDVCREVNYSKGHLSKVERGDKKPSMPLARACDALFETGGRLAGLVGPPGKSPGRPRRARRDVLATGVGSFLGTLLVAEGAPLPPGGTVPPAHVFRDQLDHMRRLGQNNDPVTVIPPLRAQTVALTTLAAHTTGRDRAELLLLAARSAEFTGWMAQEAGDARGALEWTAEAVELAQAGGDRHLKDYALVRQALVTFYDGRAQETIALAERAQRSAAPPRVRGLAAQREAQGHALAGDEKACLRALDRARGLLVDDDTVDGAPVLGPSNLPDPVAMVTGWCLYDLGRHRQAAAVFEKECARLPRHAVRTRARYGLRGALAHAASGEVERSCQQARELLGLVEQAPSATIRADVRRLDRELGRFRSHPAVRELRPSLAHALGSGR